MTREGIKWQGKVLNDKGTLLKWQGNVIKWQGERY